jgi:hypothetical protein
VFFEQVIRENLDLGRPEEIKLIFNRRIRGELWHTATYIIPLG